MTHQEREESKERERAMIADLVIWAGNDPEKLAKVSSLVLSSDELKQHLRDMPNSEKALTYTSCQRAVSNILNRWAIWGEKSSSGELEAVLPHAHKNDIQYLCERVRSIGHDEALVIILRAIEKDLLDMSETERVEAVRMATDGLISQEVRNAAIDALLAVGTEHAISEAIRVRPALNYRTNTLYRRDSEQFVEHMEWAIHEAGRSLRSKDVEGALYSLCWRDSEMFDKYIPELSKLTKRPMLSVLAKMCQMPGAPPKDVTDRLVFIIRGNLEAIERDSDLWPIIYRVSLYRSGIADLMCDNIKLGILRLPEFVRKYKLSMTEPSKRHMAEMVSQMVKSVQKNEFIQALGYTEYTSETWGYIESYVVENCTVQSECRNDESKVCNTVTEFIGILAEANKPLAILQALSKEGCADRMKRAHALDKMNGGYNE